MDNLERARVFFRGAFSMLGNGFESLWKVVLAHKKASAAFVFIVAAGLIALPVFLKKTAPPEQRSSREVTLVRVADISGSEPLSIIATVRAVREAQVAANTSGRVSAVYRSLGDTVPAGTIIAEIENARERAAVTQARAGLEKAKSGTAVGAIGISNASNAYSAAQSAARATIEGAYATLEDAVTRKADQAFSNPKSTTPQFLVSTSNAQFELNAENKRVQMQTIFARIESARAPSEGVAQIAELNRLSEEAALVADFLAAVSSALQAGISTGGVSNEDIATYRADVEGALSGVNALRGTLSATIENLESKKAAVAIAEENVTADATGKSADIAVAEGVLAGALANLENTLIRAPISGTINRLDISLGNFLSASVPVVYIANPQGLEAVAYLSERDLRDVAVGAQAILGGSITGTVVKKANALDPTTKKAEIRISVPLSQTFVSGQSTTVDIERSVKNTSTVLTIPLSAIKITPDGAVVFSVNETSALVAHPITLGTLRGAKVEVAGGLDPNLSIALDARGLNVGETVTVKE